MTASRLNEPAQQQSYLTICLERKFAKEAAASKISTCSASHNDRRHTNQDSRNRLTTIMNSKQQQRWSTTVSLLLAYITFGALHELAHLLTAVWLLPSSALSELLTDTNNNSSNNNNIATLILHISLGRCLTIPLHTATTNINTLTIALITHSGWIASTVIAILCHVLYKKQWIKSSSSVVLTAYITALEGMTTDLLGFVPHHHNSVGGYMTFFCGNFGVLLLNSSWLSIDGGRTALDVLEKMVSLMYYINADRFIN